MAKRAHGGGPGPRRMLIREMIEASPLAAVVTAPRLPDNPIVVCNRAFEQLTGYSQDEVVGRNCRFLAGSGAPPFLREEIATAVRERRPILGEVPNFKKDGTPFRNALMIAPVFDEAGELEYFLGSQAAVPDARAAANESQGYGLIQSLPERQRQVLAGVVAGQRNKQIAHTLGISERTVKMHRASLLQALGARSTADAIRFAVEAAWTASLER